MPSSSQPARAANGQRWRLLAVCRPENGLNPEIWFPPSAPRPYATKKEHEVARRRRIHLEQQAKALCATCQVTRECLQFADDNDEREGVWGGLTVTERGKAPIR